MTTAEVTAILDLTELVLKLDLEGPDSRDHLIQQLRDRRMDDMEALLLPDPDGVPTASMLHLCQTRWDAIGMCEAALDQLGEPYVVEVSEEAEGV